MRLPQPQVANDLRLMRLVALLCLALETGWSLWRLSLKLNIWLQGAPGWQKEEAFRQDGGPESG